MRVRRRLRALMPVHPQQNDHSPSAIHLDSHASRAPCASQVPRVYEEFSKARVLTMSFEEGCNVTDVAAILGMGLKVQDVARRLTEAFNKQIFEAGFGIVCFQHLPLLNFSCIVDVKTQCTSCNVGQFTAIRIRQMFWCGPRRRGLGSGTGRSWFCSTTACTAASMPNLLASTAHFGGYACVNFSAALDARMSTSTEIHDRLRCVHSPYWWATWMVSETCVSEWVLATCIRS